jgi:hypothetical protein
MPTCRNAHNRGGVSKGREHPPLLINQTLKKPKNTKRFFYHYNKPQSLSQKRNVWSIHFNNQCILTHHVICLVPVESKENKKQPRAVMQGFASSVTVINNTAIIQ